MRTEFLRFLLTGSANTAASWVVYLFFNLFLPYTAAYTISYAFGMVFTYYMNTRWVFKVPMKWSTFMQFPVIFALRYCMDVSVLFILVKYAGNLCTTGDYRFDDASGFPAVTVGIEAAHTRRTGAPGRKPA